MSMAAPKFTEAPSLAESAEPKSAPTLERVVQRVRLRAQRRTAWLRKLWAEEGEPGGKLAVTHAEIDTHLADRDDPRAEAQCYARDPNIAELNRVLARIEAEIAADQNSRLAELRRIFGLSDADSDLFQACLALALDPSLGRIYAYLQDHAGRGYVTDELAARLFGHGRGGLWNAASPLARWTLVQERETAPGEPPLLACDPLLRDWVQGHPVIDTGLIGAATLQPPLDPLSGWPVAETASFISRALGGDYPAKIRLQVVGPHGSGRRTLAATISARLELPLLVIDSDALDDTQWVEAYRRAQRQAYLDRMALAWAGESLARRSWPGTVPPFPVQFLLLEPGETSRPSPSLLDRRIEMPLPGLDERRALWHRYLPNSAGWPWPAFEALVQRHRVTVGEIAAVARTAPSGAEEAAVRVREHRRQRLGRLAQHIECPFTRDDLVVPERIGQVLDDLVFEAEHRAAFWERPRRGACFPKAAGCSRSLAALPAPARSWRRK